MTPDPSFVKDLRAYDPLLRCRWGTHTGKWIIERKMDIRNPQLLAERPGSERGPRAKDLGVGWRESYLHVLSVDPSLLSWHFVGPELRAADVQFAGSWAALSKRLDALEEKWEAEQDKTRTNWVEGATSDAFDMLQWRQGNRVATPLGDTPEPLTEVERHDGFLVRVSRHLSARKVPSGGANLSEDAPKESHA